MKQSIHRRLSLLCVALLLGTLVLPSVALATEPDQIEVTISADTVAPAPDPGTGTYTGEDGATIVPDAEDNGYSYNTRGNSTDVSLQGEGEDLVIEQDGRCTDTTDTIPNSAVTGAVPLPDAAEDDLNDNDIYLGEYTDDGGNYSTEKDEFYGFRGRPEVDGIPPACTVQENDGMVADILESNGIEPERCEEYLVEVGETVITGDKQVSEVTVKDTEGNVLEGYEVTLEVTAERGPDQIFDESGRIDINGKTNVILTIDISSEMKEDLNGNGGGEMDIDSRWTVLKKAATGFIDTLYGIERDDAGNIENEDALNDDIGLSLVVYSGGNNNTVARTITVSTDSSAVFTSDDVDELLGYFTSSSSRSALAGGTDMLHNSGVNAEAGYKETTRLVQQLENTGVEPGDIHVVFLSSSEPNSFYYTQYGQIRSSQGKSSYIGTAIEAAREAEEKLLEKGVSLHNINIDNHEDNNDEYMDPHEWGYELSQSAKNRVDYTYSKKQTDIINAYEDIAKELVKDALVAERARVIDVVPAGFDVHFYNDTDIKVVGKDAQGNTVIEWYIGNLENGAEYSTRYFLIPNSSLTGEYTYGTAYTNDSAILFARPVVEGGDEIAIVLDRPAVILDAFADDDAVQERFKADFDFNVIDGAINGASKKSVYNLLTDSDAPNKLQAVGTTVSDTYIGGVTNARIAGELVPVTQKSDGSFVFETTKLRVVITPDGSVSYERLGSWPHGWGKTANVTFEYSVLFDVDSNAYVAGVQGGDQGVTLVGAVDSAVAGVNITLQKPKERDRDDDDDDDDDDAILIPLSPVIVDIPLGIPKTGGTAMLLYSGVTLTTLAGAAFTLLRRRKKN